VPVVLISAVYDLKRRAARLGLTEWMPKPVEFDELAGVASRHCS
jgi:hypothetical protein